MAMLHQTNSRPQAQEVEPLKTGSVSAGGGAVKKLCLPAIPLFHWASFRFVLLMVGRNAATRRGQIRIERNRDHAVSPVGKGQDAGNKVY